jgi:threonyl-tRNA synthetase
VSEKQQVYAREVGDELRALGVRVHVDDRNEKLGYRIREAQLQKVPYMLVVGDKEVEAKSVSVRHRQAGDLGPQEVAAFGARVVRLARERAVREEDKAPSGGGVS